MRATGHRISCMVLGAVLAVAFSACQGTKAALDSGRPADGGLDGRRGDGARSDGQRSDGNPAALRFEPAGPIGPGSIGLRLAAAGATGEVSLELVLGAHDNVYGIAGGLSYDPSAIEYLRFKSSGALEGTAGDGLIAARANPAGRLLFALSKQGRAAGSKVAGPLAVATLSFRALGSGKSTLAFLSALTSARDDQLQPAAKSPTYVGGELIVPALAAGGAAWAASASATSDSVVARQAPKAAARPTAGAVAAPAAGAIAQSPPAGLVDTRPADTRLLDAPLPPTLRRLAFATRREMSRLLASERVMAGRRGDSLRMRERLQRLRQLRRESMEKAAPGGRRALRLGEPAELTLRHVDIRFDPDLVSGAFTSQVVAELVNPNQVGVSSQIFYLPVDFQVTAVRRGETPLEFQAKAIPEWGVLELTVEYGAAVVPQEKIALAIDYRGTISCESEPFLGILLCVLSPTYTIFSGYQAMPYFFQDASFDLWLTHPANLAATVSGFLVGEETLPDGRKRSHFANAHFSSMIMLAIGAFDVRRETYGPLSVAAYSRATDGAFRQAYVEVVRDIIQFYSTTYAPYAFPKLDYVAVGSDMGFGGMAGSGLVMIANDTFQYDPVEFPTADMVVAHEVGHEWFGYMLNGADRRGPWLVEGVTQFITGVFEGKKLSKLYDRDLDWYFFSYYNDEYIYAVPLERDQPLTGDIYLDPNLDPGLYVELAYTKGPLITNVIAHAMGGWDVFAAAARRMAEQHQFVPYDTEQFRADLEASSGKSLGEVFDSWVYAAGYPTYTVRVKNETGEQGGKVTARVTRSAAMPAKNEIMLSTVGDQVSLLPLSFTGSALSAEAEVQLGAPLRGSRFDPSYTQLRRVVMDPAADINGTGEVDGIDLVLLGWAQGSSFQESRTEWESHWYPPADVNFDGLINEADRKLGLDHLAEPNR